MTSLNMKKRNYFTEKTIAIFQIIFNSIFLAATIYGVYINYGFAIKYLGQLPNNFSLTNIVLTNQSSIVLSVVAITGGALLLFQKKTGWVLTLATSAVTGMLSLFNLYNLYFSSIKPRINSYNILLGNLTICLIYLLISFILISKPFKTKYNSSAKTWWIIFIIIAVLIADKILL